MLLLGVVALSLLSPPPLRPVPRQPQLSALPPGRTLHSSVSAADISSQRRRAADPVCRLRLRPDLMPWRLGQPKSRLMAAEEGLTVVLNTLVRKTASHTVAGRGRDWRLVFERLEKSSGRTDGLLGEYELQEAVSDITGEHVRSRALRSIIHRYDLDGDGALSYDEFETMLKKLLNIPHDRVMLRNSPIAQPERYTTDSIWLSSLRNFGGSQVLRGIANPLVAISVTSSLVALIHGTTGILPAGRASKSLVQMHSLLGGALSLLLVFRTNSAYNRFWEARRIWESVLNRCRDLARFTYLYRDNAGAARVHFISSLLCAFPRELRAHLVGQGMSEEGEPATKRDERLSSPTKWSLSHPSARASARNTLRMALKLDKRRSGAAARNEDWAEWGEGNHETRALSLAGAATAERSYAIGGLTAAGPGGRPLPSSRIAPPLPNAIAERVRKAGNKPLYVCKWLASELKAIPDSLSFTSRERLAAVSFVNQLSSYVGACERLLQTPVPLNYARHTSRFLTLWCLTLPISLVETMGLLVVPVTAFVTWCLFGIQEIGLFIEHCALDDGTIFMDTITELVALDVMEALEEEEPWDDEELRGLDPHYSGFTGKPQAAAEPAAEAAETHTETHTEMHTEMRRQEPRAEQPRLEVHEHAHAKERAQVERIQVDSPQKAVAVRGDFSP